MSDTQVKTHSLTVSKTFSAPVGTVFAYFTDPALLSQWHAPNLQPLPRVEVDLRVGGCYRFEMSDPEGNTHVAIGKYQEITRNKRLVFTWQWEGGPHPDTTVTIEFAAQGKNTVVTLVHTELIDEQVRDHHTQGWNAILQNLEMAL